MASHIPILAPELLHKIFSYVDTEEDLRSIVLSCKQFNELATPYLYEHIDLVYEEDDDNVEKSFTFKGLRTLTILILLKPELAKRVKYLSLRGIWTEEKCNGGWTQSKPLEPEFDQALKELSHTQEEKKDWAEDIQVRGEQLEEDAILAILLATLVNLKSLDFELADHADDITPKILRILKRVRNCEKPFDATPALSSAKNMLLASWDEKYGIPFEYASAYITLPSLKNVFLHRIGSDEGRDEGKGAQFEALKPGSLAIETIDMHDCRLSSVDIRLLMEAPKALRSFCYELGWGYLSECSHSTAALLKALQSQKETLKELWLYHVEGMEFIEETSEGQVIIPPGGLSQLTKLKHMKIATCFVFDEDYQTNAPENVLLQILPPNLETFTLQHWKYDSTRAYPGTFDGRFEPRYLPDTAFKAVYALLQDSQVTFPSLKSVTLDVLSEQAEKQRDSFMELLTVAKSACVQFRVLARKHEVSYSEKEIEREWGFNEDVRWRDCKSDLNKRAPRQIFDLQEGFVAEEEKEGGEWECEGELICCC